MRIGGRRGREERSHGPDGTSGSGGKIRKEPKRMEASQPIVSEFVYDDSALSKKFLWLTSTSSTRNTKVNPFNGALLESA